MLISFIFDKLLEDQILSEEEDELAADEPRSCLACVKLKLLLISFSLTGDIFSSHLVWLAKFRFSLIELVYACDKVASWETLLNVVLLL